MSEQTEPLTPSEAAQILSNYRWNKDEAQESDSAVPKASGEQVYGKESVERGMGWSEMDSAYPVKTTDEGEVDGSEILKTLGEQPGSETPTAIERQYQDLGTGAPKPLNETVSAEQASHDLSLIRESEAQALAALEAQQLAAAVD